MKKRIISAVVLLAIFIPLLLWGGLSFAILMSILAVLALYELLKLRSKTRKLPAAIELFSYLLVHSVNIFTLVSHSRQNDCSKHKLDYASFSQNFSL